MRKRWSMGVVVVIAVAIATAVWSGEAAPRREAASPSTSVTLSLQSEGIALRVVHGGYAVTVKF